MKQRHESGKRLRAIRERVGISQQELGQRAGINPNSISNWELGIAYPQYPAIRKLCKALGCSADELLGLPLASFSVDERLRAARLRELDPDGLHTVDVVIDSQLERIRS